MRQSADVAVPVGVLPCYAVDPGNRCLWRDRERLDLPPKAFDVLDYLRRNPGRLVSQNEILDQVWPNRFVQPEIVKTYIRTLRRLLEDDVKRPRFIETRPRSGYRFLGKLPDRRDLQPLPLPRAAPDEPLLGRQADIATLQASLDCATAGRRGHVVVSGESGLGKSALLDLFVGSQRELPATLVAVAYGAPAHGVPEPLSLAIALMQDVARQVDPSVLGAALAAHAPGWTRHLAPGSSDTGPSCLEWWPQRMVREACALIEHLAASCTLVLAVDDLQWADADTIDLLVALALRRYPARLLVVTGFRQVAFTRACPIREALDGLLRQSRARELALEPLKRCELVTLLQGQGCLRQAADPGAVVAECGGNPRLLGSLAGADGDRRRMVFEPNVPLAVRTVLEAGSIAGTRFCAWAVARILDDEQEDIERLLSRLALARQYVRADGSYLLPDGTRTPVYAFLHPVDQRLLLEGQIPSRRHERHRKFGAAIVTFWGDGVKGVASDVSHCFHAAGDWSGATIYSRLAGEDAWERDRPVEAIKWLNRALGFSARLPAAERLAMQEPIRVGLRRLGDLRA